MDFKRSQRSDHIPIHSNRLEVEIQGLQVPWCTHFLSLSLHSDTIVRTAYQCLYFLRRHNVKLLPLHHREHSNQQYHCMVQQLLFFWSQSSSEWWEQLSSSLDTNSWPCRNFTRHTSWERPAALSRTALTLLTIYLLQCSPADAHVQSDHGQPG